MTRLSPEPGEEILNTNNYPCGYCGNIANLVDYCHNWDPDNLVAACFDCNGIASDWVFERFEEKAAFIRERIKSKKWQRIFRKRGHPKDTKNKVKAEVILNFELFCIEKMAKALLLRRGMLLLGPVFLAMDVHFGNYSAFQMVRQCGLHLISKLRCDAALFFARECNGYKCKYRKRMDYANIPENYLKSTTVKDSFQTNIYQAQLLQHDFPVLLNEVIIIKKNLFTQAWRHVILFSSDLELSDENLVDYYSLRFQIEFNFRNAKQFWGLENFMNIKATVVTNAANLSLFMVNLSQLLMCDFRQTPPDFGVLDIKSYYRGCRYATELLEILSEKPDDILITQLFRNVAALGSIYVSNSPVSSD